MKLAAAVLALAAAVSAHNNVTYVTEVVDVITTYCPEPTTITYGTETITVTEVRRPSLRSRGGDASQGEQATVGHGNVAS